MTRKYFFKGGFTLPVTSLPPFFPSFPRLFLFFLRSPGSSFFSFAPPALPFFPRKSPAYPTKFLTNRHFLSIFLTISQKFGEIRAREEEKGGGRREERRVRIIYLFSFDVWVLKPDQSSRSVYFIRENKRCVAVLPIKRLGHSLKEEGYTYSFEKGRVACLMFTGLVVNFLEANAFFTFY